MFPEQEHPGDCGLNALYTVLLLNDILPDYDQLREVVSPQPNTGNTLVELRDAARVYELELDLVWVTPQELQFYDLPLIIHCEKWIDEGHYRVVVSFTDDNRVRVMETRNGLVHEVNLSKVDFSGFALVPHARCVHEWRSWTLFAFCGALGVFLSIRALTHGLTARQIPRRPSGRFGKIVVFALIMSLVLCLLITMTRHGISNVALRELPRFSEVASHQDPRPIEVQPLGRPLGGFAADEMNRLLALTTPYWSYRRASDMLHCLRLWGPKCAFLGLPSFPSEQLTAMTGGEMVHALTESSATHFRPTRYGLGQDYGGSLQLSHADQMICVFAEIGIPLDQPINVGKGRYCVYDLLQETIARYGSHDEIEFTAVALAGYLAPEKAWRDRFGNTHTFDELATTLIKKDPASSTCYGAHIPYALAYLWNVDQQCDIVMDETENRIEQFLRSECDWLAETQGDEGWWQPRSYTSTNDHPVITGRNRFVFTAHTLDWLPLVPEEWRPSRHKVVRAMRWASCRLEEEPRSFFNVGYLYCPNSHLVRGITRLEHFHLPDEFRSTSEVDLRSGANGTVAGRQLENKAH
jgi:hypothetical protein